MVQLDAYLTEEEFSILEEIDEEGINRGLSQPVKHLLQLSYIYETAKGVRTTSAGTMRLALGR